MRVVVWAKSAGRGHAPLQGDAPLAGGPVDALLPRPRPARPLPQAADAEEHLDQPVVLEGLDAPGQALVEPALVDLGGGGRGVGAVDVHGDLGGDRRLGREVADVGDQRRIAQPGAQVGDAVGQDVGPLLPGDHARWAAPPTRRCRTGAARRAGRTTSRAARRRSGTPCVAQVVDGGDDRAGDVVAGLGAVPVGGAVVGPVRRARRRGRRASGPGARCRPATAGARPQASRHCRGPSPASTARSVAKPAGTSSRSPCHPQRTVPPLSPTVWSWKASSGATSSVRPSGAREEQRPAGRRPVGEQEEPVEGRRRPGSGRPNSQCWKATARRPSGAPPGAGRPG